jgi:CHAT domain-containing protein
MRRKQFVFWPGLHSFLKYVFLGIGIALFLSWGHGALGASDFAECSGNDARCLTEQGHKKLNMGQAEEARIIWEGAMEVYERIGNQEGVTGSRINQSLALQALGQYRRACKILLPAVKLDYRDSEVCKLPNETEESAEKELDFLKEALQKQKDSPVSATGLRVLGDVLRLIGNLKKSEVVLQESLEMAERLKSPSDISASGLSLGNTQRSLYSQARNLLYDSTEPLERSIDARKLPITKAKDALRSYEEAAKSNSKSAPVQAQLNRLSLLLELEEWLREESKGEKPDIAQKLSEIQSQIQPLVEELLDDQSLFAGLPPIPAIYARLNLAVSLGKLKQDDKLPKLPVAIQHAQVAVAQAKELGNQRAEAYALGILGNLYAGSNEPQLAQDCIEKALPLAESVQASDIVYELQYQLGRLYKDPARAVAAYEAAVNTLDAVRKDLLSVNADLQFSFRENVRPVYEDLLKLYLKDTSQDNLKKALALSGKLQLAELENFLQCGDIKLVPLDEAVAKLDSPPVIIQIVILNDSVEVIFKSEGKPLHYHRASLKEVTSAVRILQDLLQDTNLRNIKPSKLLPDAEKLYNLLIAPAESYLPPENGTLVFVLDSSLQNIPMALLHGGDRGYLVEKYSIAQLLGSRVREPKFLPWEQSKALIAGVSQARLGYRELNNVPNELQQIERSTAASQKLLNERFTRDNFQKAVTGSDYPIIHLATHGEFSSDPEKTVILAYDDKINVRQLDRLLRRRTQGSRDTIELLVLSACQTAKGDRRAGLGIAGVAVQAGARSTLASLWKVSDKSTALFMSRFYQELKAGKTKAEALRQAQLDFLKNHQKQYNHPYYWAPFILAGSWL